MTVNQISIFLENKYGKLSEILALLAEERIRIIAATVADTSEYGILRIIVSDPQKAYKILKENNVSANLTDVLAIVTSSCAGSFANTLSYFTKGHQHRIYVLFLHPGKSDLDLAYEQPGKRP